jgi:hypothetical protein
LGNRIKPDQLRFVRLKNHSNYPNPIKVRKFASPEGEGVKESQFAELLNPYDWCVAPTPFVWGGVVFPRFSIFGSFRF